MNKLAAASLILCATLSASVVRATEYPADNSGKNARDRDPAALTAQDQSNSKTDVKITQQIRKAVVADKRLSTNAHNVKIITADGVVTLRGPVKTQKEKSAIAAKAQRVAGVSRVDNQIEVVAQ